MTRLLFDTHCHIDFAVFDPDREAVLRRCRQLGVRRLLVAGVCRAGWSKAADLCREYPGLLPAWGLHPCFLDQHGPDDLSALEAQIASMRPVAVGETGLDFWNGTERQAEQEGLFLAQVEIAARHRLPLVLHVRKAHDRILMLLRRSGFSCGGVVHAFSGSLQQAEQYLALGFRIGIGGGITYPRAQKLRRTVAALPADALVLETDAPDMPFCGRQGARNSPEYLPELLPVLAGLRGADEEELAAQLWRNSCALFALSPRDRSRDCPE